MHFKVLAPLAFAASVAAQSTQVLTTASAPPGAATSIEASPSSSLATAPIASSSLGEPSASSPAAQPTAAPGGMEGNQTILQYLMANFNNSAAFSEILGTLGQDNNLLQALNTTGNYTVFVPSDQAIQSANMTLINNTYGGIENVIPYHVVNQTIFSQNITEQPMFVNTELTNSSEDKYPNNTGLPIGLVNNMASQNGQNGTPDQNGQNGDSAETLLVQDDIATNGSTGNTGIQVGYGFDQTANVIKADVMTSNGVIHYVDDVLLPPAPLTQTLQSKQSVSMLVSAIQQLNLTNTINNASGITLFAPNNEALQNANLSQYDNETLAAIVRNHIVQGVYFTSNITGNSTINSLSGGNLTVANITTPESSNQTQPSNGTEPLNQIQQLQYRHLLKRLFDQDSNTEYVVDNATVVDKNVLTDNGVVHIINQVLLPANMSQNGTNGTNGTSGAPSNAAITGTSWPALLVVLAISMILV